MYAPVCYFVYDRPDKVKVTLNALKQCQLIEETQIYIFSDTCKQGRVVNSVVETKQYINQFIIDNPQLKISLIEWKKNAGPYYSLSKGMQYALDRHGRALRIEDDILVSKDFLVYMNKALDYYENDQLAFCVSGYNPRYVCNNGEYFMSRRIVGWGMGIWKSRFDLIDWNDKEKIFDGINIDMLYRLYPDMPELISTNAKGFGWDDVPEDVYMGYCMYVNGMYTVLPNKSYCDNIGLDGSGCHITFAKLENSNWKRGKAEEYKFSEYVLNEEEEYQYIKETLSVWKGDTIFYYS